VCARSPSWGPARSLAAPTSFRTALATKKWAFRPGTTEADIVAALAENETQHARAPGSASPIHLVVERKMNERKSRP
jgi:hypothetical protein